MKKVQIVLLLLGIILLGASLRLYGLNWDQNQHLHPDERFLTSVTLDTDWPSSFAQYLDTDSSPLNPQNKNHSFFVYGLFPITLVKGVSTILGKADYANITLVGRAMSAIIDSTTIAFIFFIAKKIISSFKPQISHWSPLIAALLYALMPLPIQLSHFYAVDPYVIFFITVSFYLLLTPLLMPHFILLGMTIGLLLASKISGILFLPFVGIGLLYQLLVSPKKQQFIVHTFLSIIIALLVLRIAQPYLFSGHSIFDVSLNPKVLANWQELKGFDGPQTGFPPALQWLPTKPFVYVFTHFIFWGVGFPLGLFTIIATIYLFFGLLKHWSLTIKHKGNYFIALMLLWIVFLFGYQSVQFAKALRYLYPIMPFIAIVIALTMSSIATFAPRKLGIRIMCFCLGFVALWTWSFVSVYIYPHTRVQASTWIYSHIPTGSVITSETWDDGLPLPLSAYENASNYKMLEFAMYDPDSGDKWRILSTKIASADYIFLTSNRIWRSLSALPERFFYTTSYYDKLFSGQLGFQLIKTFTSYPCLVPRLDVADVVSPTNLLPPAISITQSSNCILGFNDDGAEESFTVYDHPKVIIFQNTSRFTSEEIFAKITSLQNAN